MCQERIAVVAVVPRHPCQRERERNYAIYIVSTLEHRKCFFVAFSRIKTGLETGCCMHINYAVKLEGHNSESSACADQLEWLCRAYDPLTRSAERRQEAVHSLRLAFPNGA